MSARTSENRAPPKRPARARNRSCPVEKLSYATTECPVASNRSTRLLPMKPAPPVTRALKVLPARTADDGPRRPEEDAEVEHEAPAVDVFQVEPHPLVEVVDAIATADL